MEAPRGGMLELVYGGGPEQIPDIAERRSPSGKKDRLQKDFDLSSWRKEQKVGRLRSI
jgi:hypothetical protein